MNIPSDNLPPEMPSDKSGRNQSPIAHPWRTKNPMVSFRHAVEGILHTFRSQRNMRFHFLAAVLVLFAGILIRLPRVEMLILLGTIALVFLCEMFNTAIEATVDLITQNYHPAAKYAKDVAAGAVLIASLNAVLVGAALFIGNIEPQRLRYRLESPPVITIFMIAGLLLLITLLAGKAMGSKGTLLQGGIISGHAAIAFFLATTIVFISGNVFVSILAILLALLVVQSRLEAKFHTVQEVIVGAAWAIFLTAMVYRIAPWLGQFIPR